MRKPRTDRRSSSTRREHVADRAIAYVVRPRPLDLSADPSSASSERMDIDISLDPAAPTAGETPQNDKSALHSTSALAMSSPSVRPGDKVAETSGPSLQAGTTTGLGVVA